MMMMIVMKQKQKVRTVNNNFKKDFYRQNLMNKVKKRNKSI